MSYFGLNFLDLGLPYWFSLAHVNPCLLHVTCATPVGLRSLGLDTCSLLGSATAHKVFLQETGECLTLWVGPLSSCEKEKCLHLMGSPFDVFPTHWWLLCSYPVFSFDLLFLWLMLRFSPLACLVLHANTQAIWTNLTDCFYEGCSLLYVFFNTFQGL